MFERELCKHELIRHVHYCPHTYNETHHWLKGSVLLHDDERLFAGNQVYQGYGLRTSARTYLVDGISGNVSNFEVSKDDRDLVFQGWDALCDKFAQPVFFEKSPHHLAHWGALSLMLEWAEQTDCDVKFIGLIRNPLGVMYSAQQLFGTNPQKRQFCWLEIQKNLLAFRQLLKPEQYYEVRYEDLTQDAVYEFAKVCEFIGVDKDGVVGEGVHGNSLSKARGDLAFGLQLDDTVKRMAMLFGYSEDDLANTDFDPLLCKKNIGPSSLKQWKQRVKNRYIKPLFLSIRKGGLSGQ